MCQIPNVLCNHTVRVPPNVNALAPDFSRPARMFSKLPVASQAGVPSVCVMCCCSDCYLFELLLLQLLLADPTVSLSLCLFAKPQTSCAVCVHVCLLGVSGVLMFIQCFCKRLRPPMSHDVRCALSVVLLEQYLTTHTHKTHAWSTPPTRESESERE